MTDNNTRRANVATVDLGFKQIEGLMLPDGSYAVGVPQLAELFQFPQNYASQTLKRLLGEAFRPHKIGTELGNQKVNVISVSEVTRVVYALAKQGNAIADEFMMALIEEGLDRRFAKAFNQKVSEEEYNERIRLRMNRILARYEYTDFIRDRYMALYGCKPPSKLYKEITVMVNQRLFGCKHFNCDRDNMTEEQQQTISQFETFVRVRASKHPKEEPERLIEKILVMF